MQESEQLTDRETAVRRSQQAWNRLFNHIRTITPSALARLSLLLVGLFAAGWLINVSRVALLPFIVGGALAYIMLPVVNKLERVLPRWIASVLVMGSLFAFFILFLAQFIPLLTRQFFYLTQAIPGDAQIAAYAETVKTELSPLPDPLENAALRWIDNTAVSLREEIDQYAEQAITLAVRSLLGLFQAIGFVLGFLVIPSWLLTVLNEQKRGVAAINRLLPDWMQPDFWALAHVVDRVFNTFVRGQFFLAVIVSGLTYLGFLVVQWALGADYRYLVALALFTGVMALIPTLGPVLGSVPVILLGFSVSTETGISVLILYILIWLFINLTVAPRLESRVVDIHPAVLMIIIVAISELGILWVLLAAPLTAVIRDLFRYVYGRVSDPPLPAGHMPGEPLPELNPAPVARPVPLAYRRSRAARRTNA